MKNVLAVAIYLLASLGAFAQTNVIRDCPGVVGDGQADDFAALQACLVANSGRHIIFNKTRSSYPFDYRISQPLRLKGIGQWLDGDSGPHGVVIFAEHGGFISSQEAGESQNVKITNLYLWGANPYDATASGIEINSPEAKIEDVVVYHFGLYNLWIHSGMASSGDLFRVRDSDFVFAGSDGIRIEGGDAQAGVTEMISATNNIGYGINDSSFLGNTHIQPHVRSNGAAYYCKGNPAVVTFVNPYSEQDQGASIFKPGCRVDGGVLGSGFNPQDGGFVFDTQGYVGTGMLFKNWNGNVFNRLQSKGNYIIGASETGAEQWRITMLSAYFSVGANGRNDLLIDRTTGVAYWAGTKQRHGANVYEDWLSKTTGTSCGTTDGISWNPSPASAGDPIGWRCLGGAWHAFGAIQ